MITTGVIGRQWRASITPWGAIEPWGDVRRLDWFVAADDRWHVPAEEATVRQRRIDGTPVTETRVRVPNGDVLQTIYSTGDTGGLTIVEITNESTMPVAIAFSRRDLLTERPIVNVPIEGIDLDPSAFVLPLGHRATLRVAIAHGAQRGGPLPPGLPTAMQVARGWSTHIDRASRMVLPDGELGSSLAERVTSERCELALGVIAGDEQPTAFLVGLGELVRMGERPDPWLEELVVAVEAIGRDESWDVDVALAAAARVLAQAGERRALNDLERIRGLRRQSARPSSPPFGVGNIAWLETLLVDAATILPIGIPVEWLGQAIECYSVPSVGGSSVSWAIRWHGARPALLWEQHGNVVELTSPVAPDWSTGEVSGEALWPAP